MKSFETQVQFWALLGPFVMIFNLLLIALKPFPLQGFVICAAGVGMLACWKWHLKGLLLALLLLAGASAFLYSALPIHERFWAMGVLIAIATTFVVSTLSFEESLEILSVNQKESQMQFENLHSELKRVQNDTTMKQQKIVVNEKMLETVRAEYMEIHLKHEKFLHEIFELKNDASRLYEEKEEALENLETSNIEIENLQKELQKFNENPHLAVLAETHVREEMKRLQQQLDEALFNHEAAQGEIEDLQKEIRRLNEELEETSQTYRSAQNDLESLQQEFHCLNEKSETSALNYQSAHHEADLLQKEISRLNEELEITSQSYRSTQNELKSLQQAFDSLNEKSETTVSNYQVAHREADRLQKEVGRLNEELEVSSQNHRSTQNELKSLQQEFHSVNKKSETATGNYQRAQYEIGLLQQEVQSLNEKLVRAHASQQTIDTLQGKIEALQKACDATSHEAQQNQARHQSMVQEMNEHIETLSREKGLLEATMVRLQQDLAEVNSSKQNVAILPADTDSHKLKSLYLQLRDQFEEKSDVLDATRRELFITQEKLLCLQREWNELHLYGHSENEEHLVHLLLKTEQELMQHRKDLLALEELVASLMENAHESLLTSVF